MDDLLTEFLSETSESLAVVDLELVKLEQNPNDEEILKNIFRLVHTVKGTCGFLGLSRLEAVAHAGENVLGKFRDGELEVTPHAVTVILKCIDTIRELLQDLEENGEETEGDDSEIISALNDMANNGAAAAAPIEAGAADEAEAEDAEAADAVADDSEAQDSEPVDVDIEDVAAEEPGDDDMTPVVSGEGFPVAKELIIEAAEATGEPIDEAGAVEEPQAEAEPAPEPAAKAAPKPAKAAAKPKKAPPADKKEEPREAKESAVAAQSIRVNVQLLENLMTLVSEMVLTRNHLLQMIRGTEESEFKTAVQHLNLITTDLQEGVMKTRMQPIGNAWSKLPRIVRDLAVETGKKIDLIMTGAETELDRQVLELIKDPLTHMVRNSADHGLEPPHDRAAAGKPQTGTIDLRAFHEGGHIIIEISDDGRGLNMDRIKKKCLENGLATEAELEAMDDRQIQQFILKPGFSTAEKLTSVSGRGVGMDVVKTNIEQIGGTLEFHSVQGKGSTFTIKIPLTLAIVSALIVECSHQRFAIPQINVLELVRVSDHSESTIEMINDSPVLRLRNRLLPLVALRDLLKMQKSEAPESETVEAGIAEDQAEVVPFKSKSDRSESEFFIVVTQVGSHNFGVIVDRVFDTEEIVVKPVAPIIRHIPFYSGNTILGDGSVIMILDPNGIAAATNQGSMPEDAMSGASDAAGGDETSSLLVFRAGGPELKAVPLALVARLEDIDMSTIEKGSGKVLVQYRGQLMPLISMVKDYHWESEGRKPVLVFTDRRKAMGLVVDEIVDIVDAALKIEITADQEGLIGSAIVAGKSTDIIDAGYYLTLAFPDWFGARDIEPESSDLAASNRILLIDDSQFFRNLLAPYLSAAGYEVATADSADRALAMRDKGATFDVIVSDIEMPGMNGFELAGAIKSDSRWEKTPLIALSSHAGDKYIAMSEKAGFSEYVAKVKRNELVLAIERVLKVSHHDIEFGEAA